MTVPRNEGVTARDDREFIDSLREVLGLSPWYGSERSIRDHEGSKVETHPVPHWRKISLEGEI